MFKYFKLNCINQLVWSIYLLFLEFQKNLVFLTPKKDYIQYSNISRYVGYTVGYLYDIYLLEVHCITHLRTNG